jgi:AAA+ superfamily predicted ATPase
MVMRFTQTFIHNVLTAATVITMSSAFGMEQQLGISKTQSADDFYNIQLQEQKKQKRIIAESTEILKSCPQELQELLAQFKDLKNPKNHGCISNTMLLYGKPGVGKSIIAKGIAILSDIVFIHVTYPPLANAHQNSVSDNLTKFMQPAIDDKAHPYIIIFDNIDIAMEACNPNIQSVFLAIFDQLIEKNPYATIIATANSFDKLPDPIKNHFADCAIEISYPSFEKRTEMVKFYFDQFAIKKVNTEYDPYLVNIVAKNNISGRNIKQIVKAAKQHALYRQYTQYNKTADDDTTDSLTIELTDIDVKTAVDRINRNLALMGLQATPQLGIIGTMITAIKNLIKIYTEELD